MNLLINLILVFALMFIALGLGVIVIGCIRFLPRSIREEIERFHDK